MTRQRIILTLSALLWVGISAALIFGVEQSSERKFDAEDKLFYGSTSWDFDATINQSVNALLKSEGMSLNAAYTIHITDSNCICQYTAKAHKKDVVASSELKDSTNIEISFDTLPDDMKRLIASTPAVITTRKDGQVAYLGPYGTGLGCLPSASTVSPYIGSEGVKGMGVAIPFDATGCYCNK